MRVRVLSSAAERGHSMAASNLVLLDDSGEVIATSRRFPSDRDCARAAGHALRVRPRERRPADEGMAPDGEVA